MRLLDLDPIKCLKPCKIWWEGGWLCNDWLPDGCHICQHQVFCFSSIEEISNLPPIWLQPKASEVGARTLFNVPPARSSIRKAKPLEFLNSRLAGQFRGNWRGKEGKGRGRRWKGFMGLSNHDRNDRIYASWTFFQAQDIFPCVTYPSKCGGEGCA